MARSDMFFKVTGQRTGEILGESSDKAFTNQIDVQDWSWGMSAPTALGGQRTGRAQLKELKLVKAVDRASTALMAVMNTNEVITTAVLTVRKAGGASSALPYLKVTLDKARINSYDVQSDVGPNGAPTLTEHLSLTFQTITFDYLQQQGTGGSGGGSSFSADATPT